jgi:signal transduction histidine kinase
VVFAAWFGGLGPAVVSIIASVFVANLFFVDTQLGFQPESFKQWTLILVFGLVSFAIALLIEQMHRATSRAMHEADQRRRSEAALRDSEQKLRAARDEALAASAAKDHFLAVLSHELRTPLNPVLLLASEHAQDPTLPEEIRAAFDTIAENVAMEAQLIDDLLDLSRIIHGKMSLNCVPADVHTIARDSLRLLATEIDSKQLAVIERLAAADSMASVDELRLKQVFTNLLKNAIRFTPAGGTIEIRSELSGDGRSLDLAITDSGAGMTPEEIERVFNAFAQGDHATAGAPGASGGLGLGLAIAKQLVEGQGGSLTAESAGRGQGSRVIVRIRRGPKNAETDASPELGARSIKRSTETELPV